MRTNSVLSSVPRAYNGGRGGASVNRAACWIKRRWTEPLRTGEKRSGNMHELPRQQTAMWRHRPNQGRPLPKMEFQTPFGLPPRSGLPASSSRCGSFQPLLCRDMHHQIWPGPRRDEQGDRAAASLDHLRKRGNGRLP